jgi:hypothetical protein
MSKLVKSYPAGNDGRIGAIERITAKKTGELMRRGSNSGNARKHAEHMVARQSTGNPDGTPSDGGM